MAISTETLTRPLTVSKKIQETDDTYSFVFDIPADLKSTFRYKSGQFISLFLTIKGEEIRRSYSLASTPFVDEDFKITVKRVKNGIASNYLVDEVQVGTVLRATPPAGHFILPDKIEKRHFVFFAAGSGITPVISIIKDVLQVESAKVSLMYCNRNEKSIIFHRELHELNLKYPGRLNFEYALSKPEKPFSGINGRITPAATTEFLKRHNVNADAYTFMCGPEDFMNMVENALDSLGCPKSNRMRELFVSPTPTAAKEADKALQGIPTVELSDDAVYIGDRSAPQTMPKKITVMVNGETTEIDYQDGQTVLEASLEAGLNPPYSCMDGACLACIAKVKSGLVYQNDMGILTEDYIEGGECLTCQARPISNSVKINYDL